jgi:hypothetical protein
MDVKRTPGFDGVVGGRMWKAWLLLSYPKQPGRRLVVS